MSTRDIKETGNEEDICPHVRDGIPKGAPGQWRKSYQEEGRTKTKNTFDTDHKRLRDPFLIFLFLVKLDF